MSRNKSTPSTKPILNALLWAAALIGSALLLTGTEHADTVFFLLMTLATISTLATTRTLGTSDALACELRVLRRLISRK